MNKKKEKVLQLELTSHQDSVIDLTLCECNFRLQRANVSHAYRCNTR